MTTGFKAGITIHLKICYGDDDENVSSKCNSTILSLSRLLHFVHVVFSMWVNYPKIDFIRVVSKYKYKMKDSHLDAHVVIKTSNLVT